MSNHWHQSRNIQAAIIGGVALIIAATIGVFPHSDRDRYPPIEIKNLTPTGEEVLARLALSPARQLLDSSAFAAIRKDDLIWNDSLGVAIEKPPSYEWGAGDFGAIDDISLSDVAFMHWLGDMLRRGFPQDTSLMHAHFYGVRLDQPTHITLTIDTRLDSTAIGTNPFRDPDVFLGWVRTTYGGDLSGIPTDSLISGHREAVRMIDSVLHSTMPSDRKIYSGVFVARVSTETIPRTKMFDWLKEPLLDEAVSLVRISAGSPNFLIVDRDRQTSLFSDALRVENVLVNGKPTAALTLNRAGYGIQIGKVIYVVMLQYTSAQPKPVLDELQRLLASVKLRTSPRSHQ